MILFDFIVLWVCRHDIWFWMLFWNQIF